MLLPKRERVCVWLRFQKQLIREDRKLKHSGMAMEG